MSTATLFQKKTMSKLGLNTSESAASKPTGFAVRMLEKYGWKEGEGLGKDKQGIATHVKVVKRDDNRGVGCAKSDEQFANAWWNDAFSSAAASLPSSISVKSSRKRSRSDSSSSDSDSSDSDDDKPVSKESLLAKDSSTTTGGDSDSSDSDDDDVDRKAMEISMSRDMSSYTEEDRKLFLACGGRRCGKRAGRPQAGKWKREQAADQAFLEKYRKTGSAIAGTTASNGKIDTEILRKTMVETAIVKDIPTDKQVIPPMSEKKARKLAKKAKKEKKAAKKAKKAKKKAKKNVSTKET